MVLTWCGGADAGGGDVADGRGDNDDDNDDDDHEEDEERSELADRKPACFSLRQTSRLCFVYLPHADAVRPFAAALAAAVPSPRYWRLLSASPDAAKAVVLAEKPVITDDAHTLPPELLDQLIGQLSSLAAIYHKPAEVSACVPAVLPAVLPACLTV
jgi:hypothetical protein